MFHSSRKTLKEVRTSDYALNLSYDAQGEYHLSLENFVTKRVTNYIISDYNKASDMFTSRLDVFQGI